MFKMLYLSLIASIAFSSSMLTAAATDNNRVTINFLKFVVKAPFTPTTTIAQLKQYVEDKEGPLPVDHLELRKVETIRPGWFIPEKHGILLEDDKTCQHYDITTASAICGYFRMFPPQHYSSH